MVAISNLKDGDYSVAGIFWKKGESKNLTVIPLDVAAAISAGHLSSGSVDVTPITGLSDMASSTLSDFVDNGGGTAIAPADGDVTIPAITGDDTVKHAVSTILAELAKTNAIVSALVVRSNLHQDALEAELAERRARFQ